jgi:hypothetical protein
VVLGATLLVAGMALAAWRAVHGDEPGPPPSEVTAQALAAEGVPADVVECVLRVAERELEVAELDPALEDDLVASCGAARDEIARAGAPEEPPDDRLALVDQPDTFGDDPVLDELWTACEAGSGAACDELFARAPIGSGYEGFGVSCGDRPDVLHCAELDRPDGEAAVEP